MKMKIFRVYILSKEKLSYTILGIAQSYHNENRNLNIDDIDYKNIQYYNTKILLFINFTVYFFSIFSEDSFFDTEEYFTCVTKKI